MFADDELLPISALAQLYYCPRRAGLTLLEQQWADNVYTVEGSILHERVHERGDESRGEVRVYRNVRLHSLRLGLAGIADCLELRRVEDGGTGTHRVIRLEGTPGSWVPAPVEYKHGRSRDEQEYDVQLCAQALCLEEMMDVTLERGYLYYEESRRRTEIRFTVDLRALVERGAMSLREMLREGKTPAAEYGRRCLNCSVLDICGAKVPKGKANSYVVQMLSEAAGENP